MKDRKGFFFVDRSTLAALALAVGILLAPGESAFAVNCTEKQLEPPLDASAELQWGGVTVPADDRQKINDLFSRYAWALDERDADRFAASFTESGSYEFCTGEGNIRLYIAPYAEIKMKIQEQFDESEEVFQPRHVLANTLLRSSGNKDKARLESKTTMLVTVQRTDGDRVLPEPDYTADVRGTLDKGTDGIWRFARLTVYADTPVFEARGR